ncbi:hypothetical protein GCM10008938_48850 [Deinococcus roseus]|uniref:DUF4132 domain-containing protein n=1 Tax=Deinococcus roseus TaxID=392414 RepID=A0ABQ2DG76_9DEIO|nr:hypothetical protein GCM10008938_48850 [Deinococcus roseus]
MPLEHGFQQVEWREAFRAGVMLLSSKAAQVALLLEERADRREMHRAELAEARDQEYVLLHDQMEALTPEERRSLFALLFPGFPDTAQAAWSRPQNRRGSAQKAFHAPGHPLARAHAARWLQWVWTLTRICPPDLVWLAQWSDRVSPHFTGGLGSLLAVAIEQGNQQVLAALHEATTSDLLWSMRGRHAIAALLSSESRDAWGEVERLLGLLEKQEGLRQVFLQHLLEAPLAVLLRLLRFVLQHGLLAWPDLAGTLGGWLLWKQGPPDLQVLKQQLKMLLEALEDPGTVEAWLAEGNGQQVFMALWATAMQDACLCLERGALLLQDAQTERRYAAALVMQATRLTDFLKFVPVLLEDVDLRICTVGLLSTLQNSHDGLPRTRNPAHFGNFEGLFDQVALLIPRLPETLQHQPLLWGWDGMVWPREPAVSLLSEVLADRPQTALLPHLAHMPSWKILLTLTSVLQTQPEHAGARSALIAFLGEAEERQRKPAFRLLEKLVLSDADLQHLEQLFLRKTAELRKRTLTLLALQPLEKALGSVRRLIQHSKTDMRQAGLQVLQALFPQHQKALGVLALLQDLRKDFTPINAAEAQLFQLFQEAAPTYTLENGLGLLDVHAFPVPREPHWVERDYASRRLYDHLLALDALLLERQHTLFQMHTYDGEQMLPLRHILERDRNVFGTESVALALSGLVEQWWQDRPEPQDHDLTQLLWMFEVLTHHEATYHPPAVLLSSLPRLEHLQTRKDFLSRLFRGLMEEGLHPSGSEFLLDALESHLQLIQPRRQEGHSTGEKVWTNPRWVHADYQRHLHALDFRAATLTETQVERLWKLLCWPGPWVPQDLPLAFRAWKQGLATENDLLRLAFQQEGSWYHALGALTTRPKHPSQTPQDQVLRALVLRLQDRILEVETARSEPPTVATPLALNLQTIEGARHTLKMLSLLGKTPMVRGKVQKHSADSKAAVFSRLIRVSFPAPQDTPEQFGHLVAQHRLSSDRLLELAVYAPQWAMFVEKHLLWTGLASAVYWLHAHTQENTSFSDHQAREHWEAEVAQRTSLTAEELLLGGVDVQWFRQVLGQLGEERFSRLQKATLYLSATTARKRAELYARALMGQATLEEVQAAIEEKRDQNAVRALGLLPVTSPSQLLSRYGVLQRFLKASRQFGAQKQASEGQAVRMALQNLARLSGFLDAEHLMWHLEVQAADHLTGLQRVHDGVTLTLQVKPDGTPFIETEKNGKVLKAIPAALRKRPEVAEILEALEDLKEQRSRTRLALEKAMLRGDFFPGKQISALTLHPSLGPLLRSLVWIGAGQSLAVFGAGGARDLHGNPVQVDDAWRIAHPHDLLQSGGWRAWQQWLFQQELQQPFKQVFRELYLLTPAEQGQERSGRFAGQQVKPDQARALLQGRNWVSIPDQGYRKTFVDEGISAWLELEERHGATLMGPQKITGEVWFTVQDPWGCPEPLLLDHVPPRLFSETLRDVDLVVSIAHAGRVEPEIGVPTMQMRGDLLRETLLLLRLHNVQVDAKHATIQGHHGKYTVHLGSATVHRQPGGAVCIVPVPVQQQGRVFLPFMEGDPKTAEVISKVLLLARDHLIQDPSILMQLVKNPAS